MAYKIFKKISMLLILSMCTNLSAGPRVALVLGGGGARGLAHLGVLEVLEENNVPIDMIVGCSIGSLIGTLYSDSKDVKKIKDSLFGTKFETWINRSWFSMAKLEAPLSFENLEKNFTELLTAKNFEELKIPLVVTTTDINTGEIFSIDSGEIMPAIKASSSIPPLFTPIKIGSRILVDGGVMSPVPVHIARERDPLIVIAVDVSSKPLKKKESFNVFSLTRNAMMLSYLRISKLEVKMADVAIEPDLPYKIFDEKHSEEIYQEGRRATLEKIAEIKHLLQKNNI